jgi:hypothetical protein
MVGQRKEIESTPAALWVSGLLSVIAYAVALGVRYWRA